MAGATHKLDPLFRATNEHIPTITWPCSIEVTQVIGAIVLRGNKLTKLLHRERKDSCAFWDTDISAQAAPEDRYYDHDHYKMNRTERTTISKPAGF